MNLFEISLFFYFIFLIKTKKNFFFYMNRMIKMRNVESTAGKAISKFKTIRAKT